MAIVSWNKKDMVCFPSFYVSYGDQSLQGDHNEISPEYTKFLKVDSIFIRTQKMIQSYEDQIRELESQINLRKEVFFRNFLALIIFRHSDKNSCKNMHHNSFIFLWKIL